MCNQERRQVIWCSYLRIAVLVNNLSSDSLSVVIPLHQIRQFYAVRVFIDHLVHTVPEIQCLTLPAPRAAVRLIIQTGDWRQALYAGSSLRYTPPVAVPAYIRRYFHDNFLHTPPL